MLKYNNIFVCLSISRANFRWGWTACGGHADDILTTCWALTLSMLALYEGRLRVVGMSWKCCIFVAFLVRMRNRATAHQ